MKVRIYCPLLEMSANAECTLMDETKAVVVFFDGDNMTFTRAPQQGYWISPPDSGLLGYVTITERG